MYPKHLKLNAVLSSLGGTDTGAGSFRAGPRSISAPVYVKRWPGVQDLLKGAGQSLNWIWALVRRIVERVARLFGVKARIPGDPPGAMEPAVELHDDAATSLDEPRVAQNLADASAEAARQTDEFLRELLAAAPDRERLKDGGAPAFLSAVLQALGTRLAALREQESAAAAKFKAAVDQVAQDLGVDPLQVLRLAQSERGNPAIAPLAPLWAELRVARDQIQKVRGSFCDYCVLALRRPDGVEQDAVEQVARAAAARWADADMMERIRTGVAAPALESGLADVAEETSAPVTTSDPVEAAAAEAFADEAAPNEPAGVRGVSSLMDRFRKMGAVDDESGNGAAQRPAR